MPDSRSAILLDSSVVVKWFIAEEDSDRAVELQQQFLDGRIDLYVPELALYEVANALVFARIFSAPQIEDYLRAFLQLNLSVLPFDINCLVRAVELAGRGLSIYDAYFAACAEAQGLGYVTADKRAVSKMQDLDFVSVL